MKAPTQRVLLVSCDTSKPNCVFVDFEESNWVARRRLKEQFGSRKSWTRIWLIKNGKPVKAASIMIEKIKVSIRSEPA